MYSSSSQIKKIVNIVLFIVEKFIIEILKIYLRPAFKIIFGYFNEL